MAVTSAPHASHVDAASTRIAAFGGASRLMEGRYTLDGGRHDGFTVRVTMTAILSSSRQDGRKALRRKIFEPWSVACREWLFAPSRERPLSPSDSPNEHPDAAVSPEWRMSRAYPSFARDLPRSAASWR